jgi:hypothetical protein
MKNIGRIRKKLSPERRARIEKRAAELIAEETLSPGPPSGARTSRRRGWPKHWVSGRMAFRASKSAATC